MLLLCRQRAWGRGGDTMLCALGLECGLSGRCKHQRGGAVFLAGVTEKIACPPLGVRQGGGGRDRRRRCDPVRLDGR
jgi:hypothetical protein